MSNLMGDGQNSRGRLLVSWSLSTAGRCPEAEVNKCSCKVHELYVYLLWFVTYID
jgi:hypothetical protein